MQKKKKKLLFMVQDQKQQMFSFYFFLKISYHFINLKCKIENINLHKYGKYLLKKSNK